MKALLVGGALAAVLGYAWFSRGEPNVYGMPVAEAYRMLSTTKVGGDDRRVFGGLDTKVSGNGENAVYWNSSGSHASIRCQADLAPEGSSSTRITAYCDGGAAGAGAAAGMLMAMERKSLIEHIDSTLHGRAFDKSKAMGATASLWPADARQPNGSFGAAVNDAIKMERDMKKMISEAEKTGNEYRQAKEMEYRSQSTRAATQPMVDLRN